MIGFFLWLFAANFALADDFRPLYIEVNEIGTHRYTSRVKTPPQILDTNTPLIKFPSFCQQDLGASNIYRCSDDLADSLLSVSYPSYEVANSTVVQMSFLSGENYTFTLSRGEYQWRVPKREEVLGVSAQYAWLGIEHIWIGFDHLLFVLCLILIARKTLRILVTITGFTVAHSITLVLAALDIVALPVPPIEAVIALSVLFLAAEIARGPRHNFTWRYPITVSSSFGLLHGLGFAAVLSEIGLPQTELLTGLVSFNIGVEIGQVIFALVVILMLNYLRRWKWFVFNGQKTLSYCIGCVAAYWFIGRSMSFLF